jgi:hypothetical protein
LIKQETHVKLSTYEFIVRPWHIRGTMKKNLPKKETEILSKSLHYLFMGELKDICKNLSLPTNGKKGEIIQRILVFLSEGTVLKTPKFPEASIAEKNQTYPLKPKTLILHCSYKNDDATRNFMKKLVGPHFHFTAFGQDWIKQCWLESKPPTYQQFAEFWEEEYQSRKGKKASPKQEWAYLNFVQSYLKKQPNSTHEKIAQEWEKERSKQKKLAITILKKFI